MKMTKKILVAALAVATFGLTSCIGGIGTEDSIIKGTLTHSHVDWAYDVEEVGDFGDYYRHISTTRSLRKDFTVEININNANSCGNSVMGAAFDITENEDGTLNFFVMGLHTIYVESSDTRQPQVYLSYFANVIQEDMKESNFGVTDKEDKLVPTKHTPYEIMLLSKSGAGYVDIDASCYDKAAGTCSAIFDVKALDGGKYSVNVYKVTDEELANPLATKEIVSDITGVTEGKIEEKLGWYVMVSKGQTLKGTWDAYDISGEPIEE